MARPKSLLLPISVDRALRSHKCQHNSKHEIAKGDLRLKVAVGRSHEHFCMSCGEKFIEHAMEKLRKISAELRTER